MQLYVVLDLLGAGRVVGVFDERARAEHVIGEFSHYYKLAAVELRGVAHSPEEGACYVVIGTDGVFAVKGAFGNPHDAGAAARENPSYRRVHLLRINYIDPSVVGWALSDEQRSWLKKLVEEQAR
jgi:hypothetical protein